MIDKIPLELVAVTSLYESGLSCYDIGQKLGWNEETIRLFLIRSGVPRRPKTYKKPSAAPTWEEYFGPRSVREGKCLVWTGFRDPSGYGRCNCAHFPDFNFAHRLSYFLKNGDFDRRLKILHRCDNPPCVEADHLWVGTQVENVADMVSKGRQRGGCLRGENSGLSKLTDDEVIAMRELRSSTGISYRAIAEQFSVSTMTAYRACVGQSWSHL